MPTPDAPTFDLAIVGAGAAGLFAAIHAGRARPGTRIIVLDGARTLGAKILVAGGGRCNVTHHLVDERAYAGSTPGAIRSVLRRFDVRATIGFFRDEGVRLKREDTGKLFPVTDSARTVLDALLRAARSGGARLEHPWRVGVIERSGDRFRIVEDTAHGRHARGGPSRVIEARRVVLATGGRSLPKSGSDGHGHGLVRRLGHSLTGRIFPALVPLTLPAGHPLTGLSGLTTGARVDVVAGTGRRLASFTGSMLCAHFGLSGPAILDASRFWIDARFEDPGAALRLGWLAGERPDDDRSRVDDALRGLGRRPVRSSLRERLPERLAETLCVLAGVDPATRGAELTRDARRRLVELVAEAPVEPAGDRGWTHAEVTAGGVPLRELELATMASRRCFGLHLCGEICDVDGRIGGFNFQWAWASGFLAGRGAAAALEDAD